MHFRAFFAKFEDRSAAADTFRSCAFVTIPTRCVSEGLRFCVEGSVPRDPSLTRRVVINTTVFASLINRPAEHRNFKIYVSGLDSGKRARRLDHRIAHVGG